MTELKPFDQSVPTVSANMHRDKLKPEVRSYADKLQEQIKDAFGKYGVGTAEDFTQAMATSRIPMDEARRINKLLSTLYTVTETGKIPFDEKEFFDKLKEHVLPAWIENGVKLSLNQLEKETLNILTEHPIPTIPKEVLEQDPNFSQRILEWLYNSLKPDFETRPVTKDAFQHSGQLLSIILNKTVGDNPAINPDFQQDLDLTHFTLADPIHYLGYKMRKGRLNIKGKAGNLLGEGLNGATVIAEEAGYYVGDRMLDGQIQVGTAEAGLGFRQKGGKIYIKDSYGSISADRSRGEIYFKGERIR